MAYRSLLENLRAEYPEVRCDAAPNRIPKTVVDSAPIGGKLPTAVEMLLADRQNQQTVWLPRTLPNPQFGTFWCRAAFRFPVGFDWTSPPGVNAWGHEHKLFIVNTQDGVGRVLVNLRGSGKSPVLAVHFERVDPYLWKDSENQHAYGPGSGISNHSSTHWPTDGQWHAVAIGIERSGRDTDRVRLFLDGREIMNVTGRTSGPNPSGITQYIVGAFYNQGSTGNQKFYVTDIRDGQAEDVVVDFPDTPPDNPPVTQPDVAAALIQLNAAASTLSGAREAIAKVAVAIDEARRLLQPK